jgi:flagellar biosynthesis activator protein FlaF
MYKFSYAEILEEDVRQARAREQAAIDHAIELMTIAEERGPQSPEANEAVGYVQKLWSYLIKDLIDPGNELAETLKADLISIGLWAIKEADRILNDPSKNFLALIEVNRTIRNGLK